MSQAPFPISPVMTAIAVAYKNRKMIADQVMPRVPVESEVFEYMVYDMAEGFTVPDTEVGRRSRPNDVEFSSKKEQSSTVDHGLDHPIPNKDIKNAPKGHNLEHRATQNLTDYIELAREVRVANMTFDANNYATNNKQTLSGNAKFSDYANSNPIKTVRDALDSMVVRGNILTIGHQASSILRSHPRILKAMHGTSGDDGVAPLTFLQDLFEVDEILVGQAFVNVKKKGEVPQFTRCWGNHIALHHRDMMADTREGKVSYALTAQFEGRIAGSIPDPYIGIKGGKRVRVGEQVKELITAKDLGYLLQDVI